MKKIITCVLCIGILLSFAACTNNQQEESTAPNTQPEETLPPEGNQVGNRCPSYDLPVVTAEGETEETVNPAKTGKITIINFWGTWCGPCVGELPHLDELAKEYADTVTVVAVHSVQDQRTLPKFLKENYPDSPIIFSWEQSEDFNGEFCLMMGGGAFYPYTVVLDANGIITETRVGAMSYEELKEQIEAAGA